MQSGHRGVVRNTDLSAHVFQIFQRSRFGRACVGGGQNPQGFTGGQMLAQRLTHWRNATAANEGHDQIDLIGGRNF